MSKPSVMRQDHGVAISFNASVTSVGGRNIFCWFYFVYTNYEISSQYCALYIYNTIKYIIMK